MADRPDLPNYAPEIKAALTDVRAVCDALGLTTGDRSFVRQARGLIVRCPAHGEHTPSCSVQLAEGVLLWNCHACGQGGDVLDLIHHVRGTAHFRETLADGARMGGLWHIVDVLEGRTPIERAPAPRPAPPPPAVEAPREWPDADEVADFWGSCVGVAGDEQVATYLQDRAIAPELVDDKGLARALPLDVPVPPWASFRGERDWRESWQRTGHRLVLPMYDASGAMRSVRAWCVLKDTRDPKRLPPSNHKASELVMADDVGLLMLKGKNRPYRVVIVEGEPDFLSRAIVNDDPNMGTIGIVNGSWCKAFAERFPVGARVAIRTDNDKAGDRYAREITDTLRRRAFLWRLTG